MSHSFLTVIMTDKKDDFFDFVKEIDEQIINFVNIKDIFFL